MTKKPLLLLLICCFVAFTNQLYAQGKLQFDKETFDFGDIAQGTPVVHEFKFKNIGNQPVVLSNVQASCGCTTPEWTNTPVLPGKTGSIKAAYNAAAMGTFNKSITVTSNASNSTQVLFIKGTVVEKTQIKTQSTPEQKAKSARASLKKTSHDFGKLENGQKAVIRLTVKNTGKEDLALNGVKADCNCVSVKNLNEKIKPGTEGFVELTYKPRMLGEQIEVIALKFNDIITPEVKFSLKAKVVESLSAQSILRESSSAVPFK